MKIVVSGGGTGGHIYPALTIADQIKKIQPEAEIIFVGTREGLESKIVPRYGYPLEFISVAGFERKLGLGTVKSACKLFGGMLGAGALVRRLRPDLVIGTGGYVCGPVLFWASLLGVPTCIQEQNAMPGVTNKILAHTVKKIFLGYAEAGPYFAPSAAKVVTGNPVRAEVGAVTRAEGIAKLGLDPAKKTVLIFGGSRGARSVNTAAAVLETELAGRADLQILHATGTNEFERYMQNLPSVARNADNIKVVPYLHEMPSALAAADLAVSRAGAIGLAELMLKGIPSILVPYPYATANHQEYNARALAKQGAAVVILDKELTGAGLVAAVTELLGQSGRLEQMHAAAVQAAHPEAAQLIAEQALALIK